MSFSQLGLAQPILLAVASEGYTLPTPIQLQTIPHVVAGRDLLGCAQTGTGKTAAFALPVLHRLSTAKREGRRQIRVLVLSPTRELAAQIGESFRAYGRHTGLRHTVVYGGVGQQPQVRALQSGVEILVATPGRLCDLMNQGYIDLSTVEILVLDEADRMLDMGFLPDVRRAIAKLPAARQTLFFSATMPNEIERLANAILRDPVRVRIAPVKATADLISQSVYLVSKDEKPQLLQHYLTYEAITRAIVFTRTKHGAERVTRRLNRAGIQAEAMHGDKSQAARQRTLANFKSNRTHVLVATDVAARGIDVDNVSHVLNYDLPQEPETYLHRIGRTGRAGANGIAVSFCEHGERGQLRAIECLIRKQLEIIGRQGSGIAGSQRSVMHEENLTPGASPRCQDVQERPTVERPTYADKSSAKSPFPHNRFGHGGPARRSRRSHNGGKRFAGRTPRRRGTSVGPAYSNR
jgi:ATP-dependent RNA helicase RhlE